MTEAAPLRDVPAYTAEVFRPVATRYAIVIPVVNEGERLKRQLGEMAERGVLAAQDTIIADGGSTDGSTAPAFLAPLGVAACLTKTGPGRLSAQLRMAYAWALDRGYAGIVTIDGNGKDKIEDVAKFVAALDDGVDYAQASRFARGGRGVNTPLLRWAAIRLIHAPIISLAAGRYLSDTTQGFRAYSRRYLTHPEVQPFRDVFMRYELLAYLSVRASQLGLSVREVPTTRSYPAKTKVPTKIAGLRGYADLMATLLKTALRRYHPKRGGGA